MFGARFASVVLAAGRSERMGETKAFLPARTGSFLEQILAAHTAPGQSVFLVVSKEIEDHLSAKLRHQIRVLVNPNPERGPLSSLQIALPELERFPAFLLHPVDHPLVSPNTIQALIREHRRVPSCILIPDYRGRKGHPVLFPARFYPDLRSAPLEVGARFVVRRYPGSVLRVPVPDRGVLQNINTREQYATLFEFPKLVR